MKRISVLENNGRCLLRFTHEGQRYSLTLGSYSDTTDRLKAERVALEIAESIHKGEFEGIEPWKPRRLEVSRDGIIEDLERRLEESFDKFYESVLSHLKKYKGNIRNKTEAKRFIDSLAISTSTKKRYYSAIRRIEELRPIFDFSIKAKKGEKKKPIDPFTSEEVETIKQAMKGNHYEGFFLFILNTGCRPSEAIGIRWKDVEFSNSRIRFAESLSRDQKNPGKRVRKTTKTGRTRFTPLSDNLRDFLQELLAKTGQDPKGEELIFTTTEGAHIDDRNFANREWQPLLKRLGIRYRSPYNLRHTFISHCLRKGVDVVTVAYWVGNSPEVIYKHYAGMIDAVPLPKLF
jgi:integrase